MPIEKGFRSPEPESQEQRTRVRLTDLLHRIRNKLIDITPSFIIDDDKKLADLERKMVKSVELSQAGGRLFDYLAYEAKPAPNRAYSHEFEPSPIINLVEGNLRDIRAGEKKSERIASIKAAFKVSPKDFISKELGRTESDSENYKEQTFDNVAFRDDGVNLIREQVVNFLEVDRNTCTSHLFILNNQSERIIDLVQLLPEGFAFQPAAMRQKEEEELKRSAEGLEFVRRVIPRDLKDYHGTASESEDPFRMSLEGPVGNIDYGNLSKKGKILVLLHEIAHAWEAKYHLRESGGYLNYMEEVRHILLDIRVLQETVEKYPLSEIVTREFLDKYASQEMIKIAKKLEKLGINLTMKKQSDDDGSEENEYAIKFPNEKDGEQILDQFVVQSEKLQAIIENFVDRERNAWAHALRVLRFFKRNGIDLEPELKTLKDFQGLIHHSLGTYQSDLESRINPTAHIKPFTKKRNYMEKE